MEPWMIMVGIVAVFGVIVAIVARNRPNKPYDGRHDSNPPTGGGPSGGGRKPPFE